MLNLQFAWNDSRCESDQKQLQICSCFHPYVYSSKGHTVSSFAVGFLNKRQNLSLGPVQSIKVPALTRLSSICNYLPFPRICATIRSTERHCFAHVHFCIVDLECGGILFLSQRNLGHRYNEVKNLKHSYRSFEQPHLHMRCCCHNYN